MQSTLRRTTWSFKVFQVTSYMIYVEINSAQNLNLQTPKMNGRDSHDESLTTEQINAI